MKLISAIEAWYPSFQLGGRPNAVRCELSIMEANGKRYLKTPFAFLNAYAEDDHKRQIASGHYYASREECEAYLAREYPNWELASPIMDEVCDSRHYYGPIVGDGKVADRIGVSTLTGDLCQIARGHKRFTMKQVRTAVNRLTTTDA